MSMTKNDSHDACLRFTSRYIKGFLRSFKKIG